MYEVAVLKSAARDFVDDQVAIVCFKETVYVLERVGLVLCLGDDWMGRSPCFVCPGALWFVVNF